MRVIQHGLQDFWAKISKINQWRQTILTIFCVSESMALIISNIAIIFTNLKNWRGIWNCCTTKQTGPNEWNLMERLAKNSNFSLIDFLHFFAKLRKLVEKMTHRKENRGHGTFKIVKSTQSYSNGHLPYYCSLYYVVRVLDAWYCVWSAFYLHNYYRGFIIGWGLHKLTSSEDDFDHLE